MPLIHWKPFKELENLFQDRYGESYARDLALDIYERENDLIVRMHVPGIDPEKIDVTVDNDYLKVSGTREDIVESEDHHYYHKEIRSGAFERIVPLPVAVDENNTRATCHDGVLKVAMPKQQQSQGKKVAIEKE